MPEPRIPCRSRIPPGTGPQSTIFAIFEGTSEVQRMIICRAVTRLDVPSAGPVHEARDAVPGIVPGPFPGPLAEPAV